MDEQRLRELLQQVGAGSLDPEAALDRLRTFPYEDLDFARIDHHRALRGGAAEVVYAPGKTPAQLLAIVRRWRFLSYPALVAGVACTAVFALQLVDGNPTPNAAVVRDDSGEVLIFERHRSFSRVEV